MSDTMARMISIASLKARARQLKSEVVALYFAARHPGTPWYAKVLMAAIVAYALSPIDLIPDFIPVLGFLDEIVLLPFAIALALRMVPVAVMDECRERASGIGRVSSRSGLVAAVCIALVWIAVIALAAVWAHSAFAAAGSGGAIG